MRNPGDKARSIDESILDSQIDLMSEEHSGSSLTDLKQLQATQYDSRTEPCEEHFPEEITPLNQIKTMNAATCYTESEGERITKLLEWSRGSLLLKDCGFEQIPRALLSQPFP